MGQQQSALVDENTPTQTLADRSLASVAQLIKDGRAKRICVMTGAGISTAAGIPDFRSPGTGLYANLARLNLPYPEAVFDIEFFRENPAPFYVLARELYPGKFSPTVSHAFIALLARKKLLRMLFTQNIDCLERAAGVPGDLIVEAHGSFASQRCVDCKTPYPDDAMREAVELGDPPTCRAGDGCNGLVKPDITFFGEQLPSTFHDNASVPATADLVVVMGTSLTVKPFAYLPMGARDGVPRVLFNMDRVGEDMGSRSDDVLCLGDCDSGVRKLADELGWRDELEDMWTGLVGDEEAARQRSRSGHGHGQAAEGGAAGDGDGQIRDELERLVEGVETKLAIAAEDDEEANERPGAQDKKKEEDDVVVVETKNTAGGDVSKEGSPSKPAATATGPTTAATAAAATSDHAMAPDMSTGRGDGPEKGGGDAGAGAEKTGSATEAEAEKAVIVEEKTNDGKS